MLLLALSLEKVQSCAPSGDIENLPRPTRHEAAEDARNKLPLRPQYFALLMGSFCVPSFLVGRRTLSVLAPVVYLNRASSTVRSGP